MWYLRQARPCICPTTLRQHAPAKQLRNPPFHHVSIPTALRVPRHLLIIHLWPAATLFLLVRLQEEALSLSTHALLEVSLSLSSLAKWFSSPMCALVIVWWRPIQWGKLCFLKSSPSPTAQTISGQNSLELLPNLVETLSSLLTTWSPLAPALPHLLLPLSWSKLPPLPWAHACALWLASSVWCPVLQWRASERTPSSPRSPSLWWMVSWLLRSLATTWSPTPSTTSTGPYTPSPPGLWRCPGYRRLIWCLEISRWRSLSERGIRRCVAVIRSTFFCSIICFAFLEYGAAASFLDKKNLYLYLLLSACEKLMIRRRHFFILNKKTPGICNGERHRIIQIY